MARKIIFLLAIAIGALVDAQVPAQPIGGGSSSSSSAPAFVSGIQSAIYTFTETSGTTVIDSSGNGNNGTLGSGGAAPTRIPHGLTFSGAQQFFTPADSSTVFGVQLWIQPSASGAYLMNNTQAGQLVFTGNYVTGGNTNGLEALGLENNGQANIAGGIVSNYLWKTHGELMSLSAVFVASAPALVYVNSQLQIEWTTANGMNPWANTNGTLAGQYFLGNIVGEVIYNTAPTQAQLAQDDQAMRASMAAYGIVPAASPPAAQQSLTLFAGDSIVENFGQGGVYQTSYPYFFSQLASAYNSDVVSNGIPSYPLNLHIATYIPNWLSFYSAIYPSMTVVSEAGVNDIALYSYTAAQIFAAMQAVCTSAHSFNAKCIVNTLTPEGTYTSPQQTVWTTVNADLIAGWLAGTILADAVADVAGDPIMGSLTVAQTSADGYYNTDQVHPTVLGNRVMAQRTSLAYCMAWTNGPCEVLVNVPSFLFSGTAATSLTMPILQLGPGWQIERAQSQVTAAFTGVATPTVTLGDTTGTATQYLASQSISSTTNTSAASGSFVSANGIVNAHFAGAANLSGFTAGNLKIDVWVVRQQ